MNPSLHSTKEIEGRSSSDSIGLISSGPPRPDTLRPGEGVWPQEGDGPVATGASAESCGGMRNEECNEFRKKHLRPEAVKHFDS